MLEVTPSTKFSSAVVAVTPSRRFSSAAVALTATPPTLNPPARSVSFSSEMVGPNVAITPFSLLLNLTPPIAPRVSMMILLALLTIPWMVIPSSEALGLTFSAEVPPSLWNLAFRVGCFTWNPPSGDVVPMPRRF